MNTDIYILSAKAMIGEDLTDDEKKTLHDYNTKYKLVRYLVMEHRKLQGFELVDFQFTPGDTFLKTSALDVANAIIESLSAPSTPLDFGDGTFKFDDDGNPIPQRGVFGNPPHTGKTKRALVN
jgi:hypothetical protein